MRYSFLLIVILIGCSSSDELTPEDLRYITMTNQLAAAKTNASDSAALRLAQDSVYHKYGITAADYMRMTIEYQHEPQRAQKVFRAIEDSLRSMQNK